MKTHLTQVLNGAEGIKTAYREMLKEKSLDIICLSRQYEKIIGNFFDESFSPQVTGIKPSREILPDLPGNRTFAKSKDASLNQVRFVEDSGQTESDLIIGQNIAVMISFASDQPHAVVITDPNLVSNLALQFELAWHSASL